MVEREAGAIVIRSSVAGDEVLVVTASRDPAVWLFPKGHIEPGEDAAEAARREASEEAGVLGTVIGRVGTITYEYDGRTIEVEYYLLTAERQERPTESREVAWLSIDEAIARLSFEDTRAMLRRSMRLRDGDSAR